jgi:hypothetical protein
MAVSIDVWKRAASLALALVVLLASMSLSTLAARAAGTGDDPRPTEDVLTAREQAQKARLERETASLLDPYDRGKEGVSVLAADIPYRYLWTPTHEQQTSYWCGPATCQVIDDHFGDYVSQSTYGAFLGTTTNGTDFSKVDDCLRKYTRKPYYYYGGLVESGFNARVMDSLLNHGMPLAADLNIIASVWPNYQKDHPGHIVPIEAFDWRAWTVRLNDVFDEADYGGGHTLGHTTYDRAVVWNGVYNHFRRAVVSAP